MKLTFEGDIQSIKAEMREFLGEMTVVEQVVNAKEVVKDTPVAPKEIPVPQEVPPVHSTPAREEPTVSADIPDEPTPSNNADDSTLDADGLPWDSRIHSSNKEKKTDGTWRKRRGMNDAALIAQVEAELRAKAPSVPAAAPTAKAVPPFGSMVPEQYQQHVNPAPAAVAPPTIPTTAHRVEMPEAPALAQINPQPFQQPAPVQALPPNTYDFQTFKKELVMILSRLANEGKLPLTWVQENRAAFGGAEVWEWEKNDVACAQLFELFAQWGFINKVG